MTGLLKKYGASISSGIMLFLAFPASNLHYLAWIALVPLWIQIRRLSTRESVGQCFVGGFVFQLLTLQWLATNIYWAGGWALWGYVLVCAILASFWSLLALLWKCSTARNPSFGVILPFVVLWGGMEFVISFIFTGFGWTALAHSQSYNNLAFQWGAFGGFTLIGMLIVLINALIGEAIVDQPKRIKLLLASVLTLGIVHGGGYMMLRPATFSASPLHVGIYQSNTPLQTKWDPEYKDELVREAVIKSRILAEYEHVDLFVWPEALILTDINTDPTRNLLLSLVQDSQTDLFAGAQRTDGFHYYNSSYFVAPGFIDMHSHADTTLPTLPTADSMLHQGITTAVVGQCGFSPAPLLGMRADEVLGILSSDDWAMPANKWTSFGSYLNYLSDLGVSVNVAALVGHGTIRRGIMGYSSGRPGETDMRRMREQVVLAMETGAIGVSTGLIYPPGYYSDTQELIEFARPAAERNGDYFTHIRGMSHALLEAIAEALRVGEETGAHVQISHYKAGGRENWHKATQGLEFIDEAIARGLSVDCDMYPYLASSTVLSAMLPEWVHVGGREEMTKRLTDPQTRLEVARSMKTMGDFKAAEWDKVLISASPKRRSYEGQYVSQLAADAHQSPHDWVFDALLETDFDLMMVLERMSPENVAHQLRHPAMMIGTDGWGFPLDGPRATGLPHPRSFGTFPRVLGKYVREKHVLTLAEATHKMTGLPAKALRLKDRGFLKRGYKADVVVFDPDTVSDRATYLDPYQSPLGIPIVFVNGVRVVDNGKHTLARPGRILRRT